MLAPDDAALVPLHPRLPGLGLLLDGEAVTEAVARRLPGLGVVGASATYVRLKPGTSCVVGYRLALRGGAVDAHARTSAEAEDPKLRKAVAAAGKDVDGTPRGFLLDGRTALLLSPCDPDLPAVARLADPARRPALLARALDSPPVEGADLEGLRHNPARRWVGRLDHPDGRRMLVKVHRLLQHRRAVAGAAAFAAAPVLASRLVGSSRRHGLTVHDWVDGPTAAEALGAGATGPAADLGWSLARLHLAEVPRAGRHLGPPPDERAQVTAGVSAVAALDPAAGEVAAGIAARLFTSLGPLTGMAPGRASLLHGDCSVDQVVFATAGPTLLDLDRAACGDAHADLGQLLADLMLRQLTGALADDGPIAAAVLEGYTAAGGSVHEQRLAALTAARLLRLAPEPFRRRREAWRGALERVLHRAAALAGGSVPA